jgi:CDP-diacylglycerol--glycerol-3-phosphate 3-phosphatidyltransferase
MLSGTSIERAYRVALEGALVRPLVRWGIRPDHVTMAGLSFSVFAGLMAPFAPLLAGIALLLAGGLDTLDGALARSMKQVTPAGAFLDSTLDRYAEFAVLLGTWARLLRSGLGEWGAALALFALHGSLMVSYARARAEGLGQELRGGLFERPERVLLLAAGLLATHWEEGAGLPSGSILLATLGLLGVGANATAVRRVLRGRRALGGGVR